MRSKKTLFTLVLKILAAASCPSKATARTLSPSTAFALASPGKRGTNRCVGAAATIRRSAPQLRPTLFSTSSYESEADNDRSLQQLDRRSLLNYILFGAAATAAVPPCSAFPFGLPSSSSEGPKPIAATDIAGRPIIASEFLSTRNGGDRSMVQGLKSDPTYLIVAAEGSGLEPYAINAECTHLGCVVPWDSIQKKFVCPCHGSQYDARGAVLRGPAPGPLKLAKVGVEEDTGKVLLENWADEDFRTGGKPWWI